MKYPLRSALLVDPHNNTCLATLYPQDKTANADSVRRTLNQTDNKIHHDSSSSGIAPLLKELMAEYAATGLPPAYLPKGEKE